MTDTTNITLGSDMGDQGLDASDISHIVHLVIQYPLFMIGFFLHIKIIHVCNVERNKTSLSRGCMSTYVRACVCLRECFLVGMVFNFFVDVFEPEN